MAKSLGRLLIVDIEATCWEGNPPAGETNEIIEIGVATLDLKTLEPVEKEGILVQPTMSRVSPFCTQLTTLTAEQVAGGLSFAQACKQLQNRYKSRECAWAGCGDYDRRQFERQCAQMGVAYPFGTTHLNIKTLVSLIMGWQREFGMGAMLKKLGITLEGTHHRGVDDAWNLARIMSVVLRKARQHRTPVL